jgi:alcohol dehydrogenase class IV
MNATMLSYVVQISRSLVEHKMIHSTCVFDLEAVSFDAITRWICRLRVKLQVPDALQALCSSEELSRRIGEMAFVAPSTVRNRLSSGALRYAALFMQTLKGSSDGVLA